jgi:hypothetical protein
MNSHNLKRTSDLRFLQYTLSGSFTRSAVSNIYIFGANFVALFSGQKCNNFDSSKTKKKQGPVVQKPINANLGLNLLNLGLNFNPRLLCVAQR